MNKILFFALIIIFITSCNGDKKINSQFILINKVISNEYDLKKFEYTTESGNSVTTQFCVECGTTVFWNANIFKGMTGIGGGTFDPPTFWYKIKREVFCRSKAYFSKNEINTKFETSPTFTKMKDDPPRKRGV